MHKVYIGNECITLADDRELELFCAPYHQITAAGGIVENPAEGSILTGSHAGKANRAGLKAQRNRREA